MSKFECPVVRLKIETHPDADTLEIATVGEYKSIVKKNFFKNGDLAVYAPEQSVWPEWLLKQENFWDELKGKGALGGSTGNRVKACRLRGVLSQGVIIGGVIDEKTGKLALGGQRYEDDALGKAPDDKISIVVPIRDFVEGEDAAEFLGITKYEPVLPDHMRGRAVGAAYDATISYDFENLKKHPNIFDETDEVAITEKLHGTFIEVGLIPKKIWDGQPWAEKCPEIDVLGNYRGIVTSKGMAKQGILLDPTDTKNLYANAAIKGDLWERLLNCVSLLGLSSDEPIFLLGEVFGGNVQDLDYGLNEPAFRAFDLYVGQRNQGAFIPYKEFMSLMKDSGIDVVPVLYVGRYDKSVVSEKTDGNTTITKITRGVTQQIREGVVVKSTSEAKHIKYGRKIAKSVSEHYLLRKSSNATEYA